MHSLRAEIDGALEATLRLQEREFEVLAESWHLMNVAYGAAHSHVNRFQSYEDISKMPEDMRTEYMETFDILKSQKREILESSDPYEALVKRMFWIKHNLARRTNSEFNNFLLKNEIFMVEELASKFRAVSKQIDDSITTREVYSDSRVRSTDDNSWEIVSEVCFPLVEELGKELRIKFFNQGRLSILDRKSQEP